MINKTVGFVQINFQVGPKEANAYFLPYTAGIVLSYALQQNPDWTRGEIIWRRDPIESVAQRLRDHAVVGFSTYVWNREYHYKLAQRIKELNPDCLIVFGGPEIPITDPKIFQRFPWMDIVVKMEGEITFANILRNGVENLTNISGVLINRNGEPIDTGDSQRIDDLDQLPSPYLSGFFDDIIAANPEVTWNGTLETTRGCPFGCTFCDWGSLTYNKVKKFGLERICNELEWLGQHCEFVNFTDANFGMFIERDRKISEKLVEVQKRYQNPKLISMTHAKNQKNEVVELTKYLVDNSPYAVTGLTVSVQSLNTGVLDIIKRTNLDQHKIEEIFSICEKNNIPVYTELILGLPGETEHSWKENLWKLFRAGNHHGISILHAQLLENAEMNLSQRSIYRLDGVPIYDYISGSYDNDEVEEFIDVVVGTSSLPREKMLDVMTWNSFIQCFHVNGMTSYIARFMAKQGMDYSEFYDKFYQRLNLDPWWQVRFAETRQLYKDWIEQGRVHSHVGGIDIPGWNLYNRLTLLAHAEDYLDQTYQIIEDFVSELLPQYAQQLVKFQKSFALTHPRLKNLPEVVEFDYDFLGYLSENKNLQSPVKYQFDTAEDKNMSPKMFLENFYFGRKRNFGKATVAQVV